MREALPARDAVVCEDQPLSYSIRASSRRRTLCLQVYADGAVRVSAPASTPLEEVREFIRERADWILAKQALFASRPQPCPRPLEEGVHLPYLDESLVLLPQFSLQSQHAVVRQNDALLLRAIDANHGRELLEAWYKAEAASHMAERIRYFAPRVGQSPARLCIRDQRTRWGSCSPNGTLSLNWRLMMASTTVVDYVVVHELCHLLHANHSRRFWAAVERILPDYLTARRQLHHIGQSLTI